MVVLYKISMGRPAGSGNFNNASVKCSFTIFWCFVILSVNVLIFRFVKAQLRGIHKRHRRNV